MPGGSDLEPPLAGTKAEGQGGKDHQGIAEARQVRLHGFPLS